MLLALLVQNSSQFRLEITRMSVTLSGTDRKLFGGNEHLWSWSVAKGWYLTHGTRNNQSSTNTSRNVYSSSMPGMWANYVETYLECCRSLVDTQITAKTETKVYIARSHWPGYITWVTIYSISPLATSTSRVELLFITLVFLLCLCFRRHIQQPKLEIFNEPEVTGSFFYPSASIRNTRRAWRFGAVRGVQSGTSWKYTSLF